MTDPATEQADNEPRLSKDPKLSEIFDFIKVEDGVNVLPVTVTQSREDTRLFIAIQGEFNIASTIMAQLMTEINNLHELAEQQSALEDTDDASSKIVTA